MSCHSPPRLYKPRGKGVRLDDGRDIAMVVVVVSNQGPHNGNERKKRDDFILSVSGCRSSSTNSSNGTLACREWSCCKALDVLLFHQCSASLGLEVEEEWQ